MKRSAASVTQPFVCLLAVVLMGTAAMCQDTPSLSPVEKTALQRMYVDYLKAEGYRPELDSDGDVQFRSEGRTYFINVVGDDPTYFRLVLAKIWPIESDEERMQVRIAVDRANAMAKVAKSYLIDDNVWVCVEEFLPRPEDFRSVFKRSLSALNNGVSHFVNSMREQRTTE